ncbi:MAG: tetratricopeptide repeat protein [Planctomycetota bacterium]
MNEWTDPQTRVDRAHDLYKEGRWTEAADELREAIRLNPHNASWHFNLGLTLEAMGEYPDACKAFEAALQLQPEDVETLNCLGVNLTRTSEYAEALACFRKVETIDPAYEPSYCNRIITYTEIGEHDEAEVMFYTARLFTEECPLCYYNMGNSFYVREEYQRAAYCWEQTLRIDPGHPGAHARLAELAWRDGELAKAKNHYQAELLINATDVGVLADLGELLIEMDDLDGAGEILKRARELDADHVDVVYQHGRLLTRREQYHDALDCFGRVLEMEDDYRGAHAGMARALIRLERVNDGAKHLVYELKTCKDDARMLHEVGELLIEAHLTHHAHNVFERLVKLNPDDAYARHNLAVSCFMLEKIDDGIEQCRAAIRIKPDYSLAMYNLALAYHKRGQSARARRYASKALELNPDDEHVQKLARRLGGGEGVLGRIVARLTGRDDDDRIRS